MPELTIDNVRREPAWIIWIHASPGWQAGTFMRLYNDGSAERVTLYDDGTEDVVTIKQSDAHE